MNNTLEFLKKGFECLSDSRLRRSIKNFEFAVRAGDGTNLQRDVAALMMVETAKYRREQKKKRLGNANLFIYDPEDNSGRAWSDVEIAVVLLAPRTRKVTAFLNRFLRRNNEAIRFQRRYAFGRPLTSWSQESGERYTRYTQSLKVKSRLGAA